MREDGCKLPEIGLVNRKFLKMASAFLNRMEQQQNWQLVEKQSGLIRNKIQTQKWSKRKQQLPLQYQLHCEVQVKFKCEQHWQVDLVRKRRIQNKKADRM